MREHRDARYPSVDLYRTSWQTLRILVMLQGHLVLSHLGPHDVPVQQKAYWGDWVTRGHGLGPDFNVMLGSGYESDMTVMVFMYAENCRYQE